MTKRNAAEAKAKELGVKIERSKVGIHLELTAFAPNGKLWSCRQVHQVVEAGFDGPGAWDFLYSALLDDFAYGLEDCDDADCEVCAEEAR